MGCTTTLDLVVTLEWCTGTIFIGQLLREKSKGKEGRVRAERVRKVGERQSGGKDYSTGRFVPCVMKEGGDQPQ